MLCPMADAAFSFLSFIPPPSAAMCANFAPLISSESASGTSIKPEQLQLMNERPPQHRLKQFPAFDATLQQSIIMAPAYSAQSSTTPASATSSSFLLYVPRIVVSRFLAIASLRRSNTAPNLSESARSGNEQIIDNREEVQGQIAGGNPATGGINGFTARPGLMLCALACSRDKQELVEPEARRSQYIDGLSYMLKALPNDLTLVETGKIRDAFGSSSNRDIHAQPTTSSNGNILSRGTAFVIFQLAVFLSFIVPMFKGLLVYCHGYEREHHVLENLFRKTLQAAEDLSERGSNMEETVMFRGLKWVAQGVVQGVSEGAGKGSVVLGKAVAGHAPAG